MNEPNYKAAYEFLVRRLTATVEAMRNPRLMRLPFDDLLERSLKNAERIKSGTETKAYHQPY